MKPANTSTHSFDITKKQIKAIKTISKIVFSNDDEYRAALSGYGVKSCTEMTFTQAGVLINDLTNLADSKTHSGRVRPSSAGVPSPSVQKQKKYYGSGKRGYKRHLTKLQAERIKILEGLLKWNKDTTVKFIGKQTKNLSSVEMLMNWQAVKVIIGMQRILSINSKIEYSVINDTKNYNLRGICE